MTLNITSYTPKIEWLNQNKIISLEFGSPLTENELDIELKEDFIIEGSFTFDPPIGTKLSPAGTDHRVEATFTPLDTRNYNIVKSFIMVRILKKKPTIQWEFPSQLPFGHVFTQDDFSPICIEGISGDYDYAHTVKDVSGIVTNVLISLIFKPNDQVNYENVQISRELTFYRNDYYLAWMRPKDIIYGTALSEIQLNASLRDSTNNDIIDDVDGDFIYDPPIGTILNASDKPYNLLVTFKPFDLVDFPECSCSVELFVHKSNKLSPTISPKIIWNSPNSFEFNTVITEDFLRSCVIIEPVIEGDFLFEIKPIGNEIGTKTVKIMFKPYDLLKHSIVSISQELTITKCKTKVNIIIDPIVSGKSLSIDKIKIIKLTETEGIFKYHIVTNSESENPITSDDFKTIDDIIFNQKLPETILFSDEKYDLIVRFIPKDLIHYEVAQEVLSIPVLENKIYPVLSWEKDDDVILKYGSILTEDIIKLNSDTPGIFHYDPELGSKLVPGVNQITVTFIPNERKIYAKTQITKEIIVEKCEVQITWTIPGDIVYGELLSLEHHLNAKCIDSSVTGEFVYNPPKGSVLSTGTHELKVTFNPTKSSYYFSAEMSVKVTVLKCVPEIVWDNPVNIVYGTVLASEQCNAIILNDIEGKFTYYPDYNTDISSAHKSEYSFLPLGLNYLKATFTPSDLNNYEVVSKTVQIFVEQVIPNLIWNQPSPIRFKEPLSELQLNAECDIDGTFTYYPHVGEVLVVGSHEIKVKFQPDDEHYKPVESSVILTVLKAIPLIKWHKPKNIRYGKRLSERQCNAMSDVIGNYFYYPDVGEKLNSGENNLYVTFEPFDNNNYETIELMTTLIVEKRIPKIKWSNPNNIYYGTLLSESELNAQLDNDYNPNEQIPGEFEYLPDFHTLLDCGKHQLKATFKPSDSINYKVVTFTVTIEVMRSKPEIIWEALPLRIYKYGTSLNIIDHYNCISKEKVKFLFNPPLGAILEVGKHDLKCKAIPEDLLNYEEVIRKVPIVIIESPLEINYKTPISIVYGTPMKGISRELLRIKCCIDSSNVFYRFNEPDNYLLTGGMHKTVITFTTNNTNYEPTVTKEIEIIVEKAKPNVTWDSVISYFSYGKKLTLKDHFNATCDVNGHFNYTPNEGDILDAGEHKLKLNFIPDDSNNYNNVEKICLISISQAIPTIIWSPSKTEIPYGYVINETILNAICEDKTIDGNFSYSEEIGTKLPPGKHVISCTFTPYSYNYLDVIVQISITVTKIDPIITWDPPKEINYPTTMDNNSVLNAISNISGLFKYISYNNSNDNNIVKNIEFGDILVPDNYTITLLFTPEDDNSFYYNEVKKTVKLQVNKGEPKDIIWEIINDNPIPYVDKKIEADKVLSSSFYNAICNDIEGKFNYSYNYQKKKQPKFLIGPPIEESICEIVARFKPKQSKLYNEIKLTKIIPVLSKPKKELYFKDRTTSLKPFEGHGNMDNEQYTLSRPATTNTSIKSLSVTRNAKSRGSSPNKTSYTPYSSHVKTLFS